MTVFLRMWFRTPVRHGVICGSACRSHELHQLRGMIQNRVTGDAGSPAQDS